MPSRYSYVAQYDDSLSRRPQVGISTPVGELDGSWVNLDRRWETYVVNGCQVTKTTPQGTRHFTITWDPQMHCWQWGRNSRLCLQWLGSDSFAWVPITSEWRGHERVWRWQRMRNGSRANSANVPPAAEVRVSSRRRHSNHRSRSRSRERHHRQRHRARAEIRDDRLPCGLTQREVYNLLTRNITPEDYDMLLRLDDATPRREAIVDEEGLEALPRVPCDEFMGQDCPVCLDAFTRSDEVCALPCGHNFHHACISTWLSGYRPTCPLCCSEVKLCGIEAK